MSSYLGFQGVSIAIREARAGVFAVGILLLAGALPMPLAAAIPTHLTQIPRSGILASGSAQYSTSVTPQHANDGSVSTYWRTDGVTPQWIQFDLGQSRWVGAVRVYCNSTTYCINGYAIYLSDEANPADWGEPVKTGNLTNSSVGWQDIPFNLAIGRYLRLVATSRYSTRIYLAEMEVYTEGFVLADPLTGSKQFTGSNTVNVVAFPVHAGYTHYQVTADYALPGAAPESWTSTDTPPLSLAYARPETDQEIVRTVWYTNLAEQVALRSDWTTIVYTTAPPSPKAHATLARHLATGYTVVKLFFADLDTGSSGGAALGLPMAISDVTLSCAQDTTPGDPLRVTLDEVGVYDVILTVMNEAGNTATTTTVVTVTEGQTCIWGGGGANTLASTAANWVGAFAPQPGDSVLFDATSSKACDWDLNIDLFNWSQTGSYAGKVTIRTKYPGWGAFTNLNITGHATLTGGVWTHPANTGVNVAVDRLSVSVGGDFTLGANAGINLTTNGFAAGKGPGAGVDAQDYGRGASHGGMGGYHNNQLSAPCYGSVTRPDTLGSGTSTGGGGALFMTVGGEARIDGIIQADGTNTSRRAGSAGGSIFLQASEVTGTGTLRAEGGLGTYGGGGGRVAVIATDSATLGSLVTRARTGSSGVFGTAGTVYRKTSTDEVLIIDQGGRTPQTPIINIYPIGSRFQAYTELPARLATFEQPPAGGGELEDSSLSISNAAWITLTADLLLGDFKWLSGNSTLDLNGHTLFLKAPAPAGAFPADYGGGTILTNDGRIVWGNADPTVKLTVNTYNSAVVADPASPADDGYYALGTNVTLTVIPDSGCTFLWWKGDLPAGVARTTHPLTVTLDGRRDLTPVVAKNDGTTHTWTGEGANRNASTVANWYPASAPASGQHIVFDATSDVECYWDLNIEPASWTQTGDYAWFYSDAIGHRGFVWIWTRYGGQGSFTNLSILGDCRLEGGAWTHRANLGDTVESDRISVGVGGDFVLASEATIQLPTRGYAASRGPGAGVSGQRSQPSGTTASAASHGGVGAHAAGKLPSPCYGAVAMPEHLGSGSSTRGGGAVRIDVAGGAVLDGSISARGGDATLTSAGAGGSVLVRAASIAGTGLIDASGGMGYWSGGGGRVALIATDAAPPPENTVKVAGGPSTSSPFGTSGTYYRQSTALCELRIDNSNQAIQSDIATELPPSLELAGYAEHPSVGGEIEDATLVITNGARVKLMSSLLMGDFAWLQANASIDLNTFTLFLKANQPAGAFPGDYGGGVIQTNGGAIVWGAATITLPVIATNGPNGSVSRDPDHPDNLYEYGALVTLSAQADSGCTFVYWTGDVPAGSNRTSNPLVVPVDQERTLRAIFASSAPATHTWIGGGANVLASNPENWYPAVAPTSGVHIVLDGSSVKELYWDLDIAVASWTQTAGYEPFYSLAEGYRGWVVFLTKYPGQGAFTNLTITGDCTLLGGTWTHPENSGDHTARDRLSVTIGGNLVIASNATINVINRGFAPARGPGAGVTGQRLLTARGASHGGLGYYSPANVAKGTTYGSIAHPTTLGSGSTYRGGGNVHLVVGAAMTVDGEIRADAYNLDNLNPGGAGGSIFLQGNSLTGKGRLSALGGLGYQCGGGGRIAVMLDSGSNFGDVRFEAYGNVHSIFNSAAGTIYLQPPAMQKLIFDNNQIATEPHVLTEWPPAQNDDPLSWRDVKLYLARAARTGTTTQGLRIGDLLWVDSASRLHLKGNTVTVRTQYHAFTDGTEDAVVVEDGGQLIWTPAGSKLILR